MMHLRSARTRSALSTVAIVAAVGAAISFGLSYGTQAQTTVADEDVATPVAESVSMPPAPRIVPIARPDLDAAVLEQARLAAVDPTPPAATGPAEDVIAVFLDHAKVIRLPERTQTVIVGNPFIADVAVQRNGIVVVTGKSYGATNLIALDAQGLLLAESMVSVRATNDEVVVVQRGLDRESYSCTPNCQPSLRLGDADAFFGGVGSQATQRSGFASQAR